MTRREMLALFCAVPCVGLPLRAWGNTKPATIALKWDWVPGHGGPIEYFEVFVARGDAVAGDSSSAVTRVGGNLRACDVSLPNGDGHQYQARVRAVNEHGTSELSAPITFSL